MTFWRPDRCRGFMNKQFALAWALLLQFAASAQTPDSQKISLPGLNISPGGVLEWPGKVRLSYGGGESSALSDIQGLVRAQPGGNLVIAPLGDYKRCALDLLPTSGRIPDMDAISEITLHRVHPTANNQEMISYSALAKIQNTYAVVVEAHGTGELKPLSFMVVRGGLPANPNQQSFSAEAMRMTPEGTMEFGRFREGGSLKRPLDSITLLQPATTNPGNYDSDFIKWVGKSRERETEHNLNWRAGVSVGPARESSSFAIQHSRDQGEYETTLKINSNGDLELPKEASAIVLRSPNGKRWRLTIDDNGALAVKSAEKQ
jgi:hypothetical protein